MAQSRALEPPFVTTSYLQQLPVALLRIVIGWHFLYEGLVKLSATDGWSAAGYLSTSSGPMSGVFRAMAENPVILQVVDQVNIYGLVIIGVALMLGIFTRTAAATGAVLLGLYYLAHPPLWSTPAAPNAEGSYLLINKTLVEALALGVVIAFPAPWFGLDGFIRLWRGRSSRSSEPTRDVAVPARYGPLTRRQWLTSLAGLPFVGAFVLAVMKKRGLESIEEKGLAAKSVDGTSGATIKTFEFKGIDELKEPIARGKIRNLEISRVIMGGNLIGGWAHARDLIYVSKLIKAYHHDEKVFETLALAEQCGVNTLLTNPSLCRVINDYWQYGGGKIQFISDCGGSDVLPAIQQSIDNGASACYIQGGIADRLVENEQFELIESALELIRDNGLPAGIGGHRLRTIQVCVDRGYEPDFWMKTLHHTKYWSAQAETQRDNIWCEEPDETVKYMQDLKQPWIAFKVLAAGAIPPKVGFKYAFQNGADFICVGMYDFQIVEDINLAVDVLNGPLPRQRDWYA